MQQKDNHDQSAIVNYLSDIKYIRRLLKAGLQRQVIIKLAAMESSLHTALAVQQMQTPIPQTPLPHTKRPLKPVAPTTPAQPK